MVEKRYVSIDIETTGLDPDTCQVLEIGAVIDDWETPVAGLPIFHCFIQHEEYRGQPYALFRNSRIFEILASGDYVESSRRVHSFGIDRTNYFLKPKEVAKRFQEWLKENKIPDNDRITVAGKNFGSFDLQFLKRLPESDLLISRIRHRNIDPAIFYWNPEIDGSKLPDLKTCLERAGIESTVRHEAVDDARQVIKLIRHHFLLKDKGRMR